MHSRQGLHSSTPGDRIPEVVCDAKRDGPHCKTHTLAKHNTAFCACNIQGVLYVLLCYLYGAYVAYVLDVSVGCWI